MERPEMHVRLATTKDEGRVSSIRRLLWHEDGVTSGIEESNDDVDAVVFVVRSDVADDGVIEDDEFVVALPLLQQLLLFLLLLLAFSVLLLTRR